MTRLIARLDIKSDKLIKGINYEGLRIIGDPNEYALKFFNEEIDEILYIDTVATLYGRNNLNHILEKTSDNIFIPVTAGGGISDITDAERLFYSGADKIFINSAFVRNPDIIKDFVYKFGSANIVSSIEAKRVSEDWLVYIDNGREKTKYNISDWLTIVQESGVGEILLTSIDQDGTKKGFDLDLYEKVNNEIKIPFVVSGGFGSLNDLILLKKVCNPSGIAIGTSLHYGLFSINDIKKKMIVAGFQNVRI